MKRCTRCLLPESYPGITFDSDGVCTVCRSYFQKPLLGGDTLLSILATTQAPHYDCIVGISGGKDSCYVAYWAKNRLKLRTLAVCYDFPFLTELARQNVHNVCEALRIELVTVKTKNNLEFFLMQDHLKSLASTGTTWGQCLFCHYGIDAILFNEARCREIPFILGGITKYELWNLENRMNIVLPRLRRLSLLEQIRFIFHQLCAFRRLTQQRLQLPLPGASAIRVYTKSRWPVTGPRQINLFDYIPWDQNQIELTLSKETNWQKPDKKLSWRYDCILEPLLDYTYKKEFGISTAGIYLSSLIRDGKIERDVALQILQESEDDEYLTKSLSNVVRFLGLPDSITERFLSTA